MIRLSMLNLRPAMHGDAMLLYRWQLESSLLQPERAAETRRYARNPAIPTEREHCDWFERKLSDPNCLFQVAEAGHECVGMVRLDRRNEEWEVSIVVAPESRGRGVGKAILSALSAPGPMVAQVLPGNEISHRLFVSSGWRLCKDGLYRH